MQTDSLCNNLIAATTKGFTNPNGCPIPVTLFTMESYSDCGQVQQMYDQGHEIATHTVSLLEMPVGFNGGQGGVSGEILGARNWLVNNCSVPAADVVGFRSPYLINNPAIRQVLYQNGFLYDSTINEHWPMPTSPSGSSRLYPYTMDAGIPQNCPWTSNVCAANERYPGMWEVPVWVLQTDSYPDPAYAMDPCDGTSGACSTFDLLVSNFQLAYNGNRAPVPIYIHSPWLGIQKQSDSVRQFAQYVSNYTDVYFVTMRQLVEWMKNPVPKDQVGAWLGCTKGGQIAGTPAPASPSPSPTPATPSPTPTTPAVPATASPAQTLSTGSPPPPHSNAARVAAFRSARLALCCAAAALLL